MIFLDTSFIVAYTVQGDHNHTRALTAMKSILAGGFGQPYISDFVFDETVTVILMKTNRVHDAVKTGEGLRKAVEIVETDAGAFEQAWNYFKSQKNTRFSFTDCTIRSTMEARKTPDLATFDAEFKKCPGITVVN